jgi:hypothetical protein
VRERDQMDNQPAATGSRICPHPVTLSRTTCKQTLPCLDQTAFISCIFLVNHLRAIKAAMLNKPFCMIPIMFCRYKQL